MLFTRAVQGGSCIALTKNFYQPFAAFSTSSDFRNVH